MAKYDDKKGINTTYTDLISKNGKEESIGITKKSKYSWNNNPIRENLIRNKKK